MRAALAVLCTCVLLALGAIANPAQAGDRYYGNGHNGNGYYGDGYYPRYRGDVWYSSDCCYKKIVRHVRQVRYVRTWPYRRYGCCGPYHRPWREGYYRPWRDGYYGRPASYYTGAYIGRPRYYDYPRRYYDGWNGNGYDAYNAADVNVVSNCYSRRVPVLDGRGGWVWGIKSVCN